MPNERSLLIDLAEAGEQPQWDWTRLKAQHEFLTTTAKFSMFSGGFASGKCLAQGSLVWMADGSRKPIEHISTGDQVLSVKPDHTLVIATVKRHIDSGILEGYRVRARNGDTVTVSATHPFLIATQQKRSWGHDKRVYTTCFTGSEWRPLSLSRTGPRERVAAPRLLPPQAGTSKYRLEDYELLGYLLGNGGLTQGCVKFTNTEPSVLAHVRSLLPHGSKLVQSGESIDYHIQLDGIPATGPRLANPVRIMLRDLGLDGAGSHDKFIPPTVFTSGDEAIARIISGLLITDGWVDKHGVGFCSVSQRLAKDVQWGLRRLGIIATCTSRRVLYKGEYKPAYNVFIARRNDLIRLGQKVSLGYKNKKLVDLLTTRLNSYLPSRGNAKEYDEGDLRFCCVDSITPVGPTQMYDLEIEGAHNFIADGFVVHNTASLCARVILLLFIPNNFGYLGRLDGKALRASTMESLYEMLPRQYVAKHNDQRGFLQLKAEYGGGKLVYGDFKDFNDLKNIPLGFFAIDQAEELPEAVWDYLTGRIRRKNPILHQGLRQYWVAGECSAPEASPLQMAESQHVHWPGLSRHFALHGEQTCARCSKPLPPYCETGGDLTTPPPWDLVCYGTYGFGVCNPEGPSHWIYRDFPGLPGTHGTSGPGLPGYFAVHATVYDGLNAGFVKADYVQGMEQRYATQQHMRERYLLGRWVEAEGLVYPAWDRTTQVIHRHDLHWNGGPLLSPEATLFEVIDHGLTAPTAVAWIAPQQCDCGCDQLDYFIIDEHYEGEKPVSYHSAAIKQHRERLPYTLRATYLDSQAFSRTLLGQKGTPRVDSIYSVADEYGDHGIYPVPTQKDWDAGYNRISELCVKDPKHRHPVTGVLGAPHLYVFSHCTSFQHEVEAYKWKRARPGSTTGSIVEEPQDANDHLMDALNGFLTSRPAETITFTMPIDEGELDFPNFARTSHMAL